MKDASSKHAHTGTGIIKTVITLFLLLGNAPFLLSYSCRAWNAICNCAGLSNFAKSEGTTSGAANAWVIDFYGNKSKTQWRLNFHTSLK